jgi:hypothetical protein
MQPNSRELSCIEREAGRNFCFDGRDLEFFGRMIKKFLEVGFWAKNAENFCKIQ